MKEQALNLKKSRNRYIKGLEGGGREKCCNYIIISKIIIILTKPVVKLTKKKITQLNKMT